MWGRKLRCSFCGKDESEVAKLVAGPRAYICDQCVSAARRIMQDDSSEETVLDVRPAPER
jgi:ATP-dependent Clp protease ATP-binding subunit ClpX